MERSALREYVTDAIKFWERCRILYNLALAAVVIIYFAIAYPQSKSTLTVDFVLGLFLLAVLANVAYCAAYLVDIFAQASGFREAWLIKENEAVKKAQVSGSRPPTRLD